MSVKNGSSPAVGSCPSFLCDVHSFPDLRQCRFMVCVRVSPFWVSLNWSAVATRLRNTPGGIGPGTCSPKLSLDEARKDRFRRLFQRVHDEIESREQPWMFEHDPAHGRACDSGGGSVSTPTLVLTIVKKELR